MRLFGVKRPELREELFEAKDLNEALILAHEEYPLVPLRDFAIREIYTEQTKIVHDYSQRPTFTPSWPKPTWPYYGTSDRSITFDPFTLKATN
jgi:hypothetical protein